MSIKKIQGISLGAKDLGEKDILLSVFSKDGLHTFVVKGGKKSASNQSGKVDLFTLFESQYIVRRSGLHAMIETKDLRTFLSPEEVAVHSDILFPFLRILKKGSQYISEESEEIFDELIHFLEHTSFFREKIEHMTTLFMIYIISKSGVFSLQDISLFCSKCKVSLSEKDDFEASVFALSLFKRSYFCSNCASHYTLPISIRAIKVFRAGESFSPSEARNISIDVDTIKIVRTILDQIERTIL